MFSFQTIYKSHIVASVLLALIIVAAPSSHLSARQADSQVAEYARTVLGTNYNEHERITQDLIKMLSANPDVKGYLEQSIAEAKKLNPDLHTNPAQSLNQYLTYIDGASRLIPQQILHNPPDLIRDQILQSICYFYFLVDQPISWSDPSAFSNRLQYHPVFSAWMLAFAETWGAYLDTPQSFTDETYRGFYNDPNFRLARGDYEARSNWNSFNRFFARYLATPAKRPIAGVGDTSIVASPADSVPQGVWPIDNSGRIMVENASAGLRVKNTRYFKISDLLGDDLKEYHNAFNNGVLTHTFLNVYDYHRYHFPVGGVVRAKKIIQQNVALEVSWDANKRVYVPIDSTGWQFTQTRGVVIIDMGEFGLAALIPMGMAQVSSVNFETRVAPGASFRKGDMLGNFLFGGSDFIVLFQSKAGFEMRAKVAKAVNVSPYRLPQTSDQPTYQHLLMGGLYGQMTGESSDNLVVGSIVQGVILGFFSTLFGGSSN